MKCGLTFRKMTRQRVREGDWIQPLTFITAEHTITHQGDVYDCVCSGRLLSFIIRIHPCVHGRYRRDRKKQKEMRTRIREKKSTPLNSSNLFPSHSILSTPSHPFHFYWKVLKPQSRNHTIALWWLQPPTPAPIFLVDRATSSVAWRWIGNCDYYSN
jgi:hypothetical protein